MTSRIASARMCIALTGALAAAQVAGQESKDNGGTLEEIVVTANKRSEEASKVPISIVAFSSEQLEVSGAKSLADVAALTPGVEFDNSASFGPGTLTNIAVRGINSTIGTSTTGVYIDDTPVQARMTALSYFGNPLPVPFDVERVEVERGPQGTLFGAGAEGGAIRFISAQPSLKDLQGQVHAELAGTEHGAPSFEAGAAFGAPFAPNELGYHLSAWYREDGGYVDRVDPFTQAVADKNANETRSYAVRGSIALASGNGLRITGSVYAQSVHQDDSGAFFEYLSNPGAGDYRNGRLLAQPWTDKFSLPSVKAELDLGSMTLTSVTSYLERDGRLLDDLTSFLGATFALTPAQYGNPAGPAYPSSYADAAPNYLSTALRQVTEELRLSSNDAKADLRWTVGAFVSHVSQLDGESTYSAFFNTNLFGLPANVPNYVSTLDSIDSQLALFGQADYRLTPKLTATVGLRVSRLNDEFNQYQQGGPAQGLVAPTSNGAEAAHPTTPKVSLSYQATNDSMAYVTIAKGFRAGGGNQPIPIQSSADPSGCPLPGEPAPYGPDSVWSYELGSKNRLMGGRLQLDGSVFHIDWRDVQQTVALLCGFDYIANTGSAASNGFDLSARAAVADGLTLGASAAFTHAYVTNTVLVTSGTPYVLVQKGDAIGLPPVVNAPWDLTASVEYAFRVFEDKDAFVRVEDIYHSRNTGHFSSDIPASTNQYDPLLAGNPDTNELNFRAGLDHAAMSYALFVNNVLNAHPLLGRIHDEVTPPVPASTLWTDYTFRPRTVGVAVTYHL